MDAERWRHVDALFAQALELPSADRSTFLAGACGDDTALRHAAEALLSADARARSFLEQPAFALDSRTTSRREAGDTLATEVEPVPATFDPAVGPYRLERLVGRGGMGSVYLARRDDGQFERRVAIKLLGGLTSTATPATRAFERFRAERQILASLEHPAIARLYDGGESEAGLPFLVMEYVDGVPLDVYCDRRGLDITERLALCRSLFDAVAFAHQNLLVHRDLKPANILVTAEGELKLLDFGIAKQLGRPENGGPAQGPRAMTLRYASPEQVRGGPITTASDLYSLGVVLYELLSGQSPYAASQNATAEVLEAAILDQVPAKPSTVANPDRARPLRGDLDAILLKALEKDPRHRYRSVSELAADLERHRARRPVSVRPPTLGYRAGKFIRRHRQGVALVATACGLVLALLVSLQAQRDQAHRERDKAQAALEFLVDVFAHADPFQRGAENVSARDLLEVGAQRVEDELTAEPEVQAALMGAIGQAAVSLRQLDTAEPLLAESLTWQRQNNPDSLALADLLRQVAWSRFLASDYAAAETLYREELVLRTRLEGRDAPAVARAHNTLGMVLSESLQSTDATRSLEIEALHREALRIFEAAEGNYSGDLSRTLFRLAKVHKDRGDLDEAERLARASVEIGARPGGSPPDGLAMGYRLLALILVDQDTLDAAQEALEQALTLQREVLPAEHPDNLLTLNDLAIVSQRQGDLAQAELWFRQALDGYIAAYGKDHAHTAVVQGNVANIVLAQGRAEEGLGLQERALAARRQAFGDRHVFVAESLAGVGSALLALGRLDEALDRARASLAMNRDLVGEEHVSYGKSLAVMGRVLQRRGQSTEAEPYLRQSLAIFEATQPAGSFRIARAQLSLGSCSLALGRLDEAEPLITQGAHHLARYPDDHPYRSEARVALGALEQARTPGDPETLREISD